MQHPLYSDKATRETQYSAPTCPPTLEDGATPYYIYTPCALKKARQNLNLRTFLFYQNYSAALWFM